MKSPRKPWWRRWFGSKSERQAMRYLKKKGYRILRRNYSCSQGEIDIIAVDPEKCLVFIEVRSTESDDLNRVSESVDDIKQQRLTRTALSFMQRFHLLGQNARFDVIFISQPPGQIEPVLQHHCHAFEASDRFQMFT